MEKITVKNVTWQDLDDVIRLENEIWPEGTRAPVNKFESRLRIFPEGFFLAFKGTEPIGVSTSEIINYTPENPPRSWEEITDNGYIRNHSSKGNAIYVVSVGAKSRSGGGSALIQAQKNITEKLNLRYLVLGARIPGYNEYCNNIEEIPVEKYVKLRRENGELYDPELRFYTRNGLELIKIMPNYMEDDRESRNYGAIMLWENSKFKGGNMVKKKTQVERYENRR